MFAPQVFHLQSFADESQNLLNSLFPIRALHIYLNRTKEFRKSNSFLPLPCQWLSHWTVEIVMIPVSIATS